jgi:DNA adenine methylase
MGNRIKLTRQDALKFLKNGVSRWPKETLIYLDPPYYVKGRDLYYDFYEHEDHKDIATFMNETSMKRRSIVSYDNVRPIRPSVNSISARDMSRTTSDTPRGQLRKAQR